MHSRNKSTPTSSTRENFAQLDGSRCGMGILPTFFKIIGWKPMPRLFPYLNRYFAVPIFFNPGTFFPVPLNQT